MLPGRLQRTKYALLFYFFLLGAVIGNWDAILPFVKDEQHLSNGMLGVILLSAIGGAMLALPIITYFNDKYGSGLSTILGSVILLVFYPVIGFTVHVSVLVLGIFLLGFGAGCADVSINGQAVLYEKATKIPSLGMFQAAGSIGSLCGALLGGFIMQEYGVSTLVETSICSAILVIPTLLLGCWLLTEQEEKMINHNELTDYEHRRCDKVNSYRRPVLEVSNASSPSTDAIDSDHTSSVLHHLLADERADTHFRPGPMAADGSDKGLLDESMDGSVEWQEYTVEVPDPKAWSMLSLWSKYETIIMVSLLCFLSFFGEGSVGDWSCIYLRDDLHSSPLISTLGYVGFSLCVAFGRYFSDYFAVTIGRRQLLTYSGLLATAGLAIVVAGPSMTYDQQHSAAVAILGFSLCGLGLSPVSPSVTSLAGSHEVSEAARLKPAESIGIVTSIGYLGIMVSPPLLGGLSMWLHSLRWSYAVDAACLIFICIIPQLIRD